MGMQPEDLAETERWERLKVPTGSAPGAPRPPTALPVGVREGDVLIIGTTDGTMSMAECAEAVDALRAALGVHVKVVFVAGHPGVTVLRPERAA